MIVWMLKKIQSKIIIVLLALVMISPSAVFATAESIDDLVDGPRTAINPDFDPDYDCNISYQLKCLPGTEQDCPEGFHNGEDNVCSPIECQEGYVGADDDETGLCITYEECEDYNPGVYILLEEEGRCATFNYICDEEEHRQEDYCVEFCEENPDSMGCNREEIQ
jgi:hypothetical protein